MNRFNLRIRWKTVNRFYLRMQLLLWGVALLLLYGVLLLILWVLDDLLWSWRLFLFFLIVCLLFCLFSVILFTFIYFCYLLYFIPSKSLRFRSTRPLIILIFILFMLLVGITFQNNQFLIFTLIFCSLLNFFNFFLHRSF